MSKSKFWTHVGRDRNEILLRGVDNGRRIKRRVRYRPTLYAPAERTSPTSLVDVHGRPVEPEVFDSMWEATEAVRERPGHYRGYDKWVYTFIAEEYPGRVEYDPSRILVGYIDIETMADSGMPDISVADREVTAITYKVGDGLFVFGCRPYEPSDERVTYIFCRDETELLAKFLDIWSNSRYCPDIISGWNVLGFDVPYLVNRITRVLGEDQAVRLSPWRILRRTRTFFRGQESEILVPEGISILDYQPLFHKLSVMTRASETPDDYKLNTVAAQEIGERKLDYSEYQSLHDLFLNNWSLYVSYNIHDVLLVEKLNDKLQLIELAMMMTYDAKVNFEDIMGSVKPWECKIHHELLADGIVLPPRPESVHSEFLIGAYVKNPEPSGYDWAVSFDVDGMYPSIISLMNLSPETKAGSLEERFDYDESFPSRISKYTRALRDRGLVVAANSQLFRTDVKGLIPRVLETVAQKRDDAKREYNRYSKLYEETKSGEHKDEMAHWKNVDKGLKVFRNAGYGVLTNRYFLFYDHDLAEAITSSGQMIIRWVTSRINEYLNDLLRTDRDYAIAGDTDSVYVHLGPVVERFMPDRDRTEICDFLDQFCETKLEEVIGRAFAELVEAINAPVNTLSMKREKICSRAIWTGKKHYILNVLDSEGTRYSEPEIVVKGMAAVKSSTPYACRERIKQAIRIIMDGTESEVMEFARRFRDDFDSLPFHDIAFPRGVSEIEKWSDPVTIYKTGTPIQVRAAIVYNRYLDAQGIRDYDRIYSGEKIKFCYLRTPNPLGEGVFGTNGPIPPGLDVMGHFDYDKMYEKGFMVPLRSILEAIGWRTELEDGATLESFFS